MNEYFRWGGAAALVFSAILVGREYTRYVNKRLAEGEGILALVRHAKGNIERYLTPTEGLVRDFQSDALSDSGFLSLLSENYSSGVGISEAVKRLTVGAEAKGILTDFLKGVGKGYKSEAIALCNKTEEELSKILESEREELQKNAKAQRALLLAASLGAAILLL